MTTVEDALDALDLARAEPGTGLLEALFARFVARVPFESASKIVRDRDVADPQEKPRRPEIFWREHVELGAGGTCFARVAAFRWVLDALGFASRPILGRVVEDFDHAALLVASGGRDWICDVGFPLPALLPASAGETETALAPVSVSPTERGFGVDLGGVPEGPRRIELFSRRGLRRRVLAALDRGRSVPRRSSCARSRCAGRSTIASCPTPREKSAWTTSTRG